MKNIKGFILLIAAITLLSPMFSWGQNVQVPVNEKKKRYYENEQLGDKYLPNAYNNKKTSPAYKFTKTGSSKLSSSLIFTTQVNVNANGQNILGDAANEPNIAINPSDPDNIVIGWRQFDNVTSNFRQAGWSYTLDAGQTWTFPGEIEQGVFRSDPVLDFDTVGNFYYNSLTVDSLGNYVCKVFKSNTSAATWDSGTDAGGGDKQWMAVDRTSGEGSGNIYSFWTSLYSSCKPGFFTRSTDEGNSFENCTAVNDSSYWGTMAVGNAGELYIAGSGYSYGLLVEKSVNAKIPGSLINWEPPVLVDLDGFTSYGIHINPSGLIGQVNIDVDRSNGPGSGNVYLLASLTRLSNSDSSDVMFAKSTDGGITWGLPIRVNDDTSENNIQWFGTLSVAPNGRIDAVWLDTRDDQSGGDSSALYYSYSTDQGTTWSVNEKLSDAFNPHMGYPNQTKMGDYFDMVSDNIGAHLAWTNTLNGEEDVYYSHIIPNIFVGINDVSNNGIFSVFPNPTSGTFVIKNETKQSLPIATGIEIYNILGEKVYSVTSFKTTTEINMSSQKAGIYFLKIINRDGSSVVKKLIRE